MAKNLLAKDFYGCPKLFLAPMEGIGSLPFRKAMSTIGGFDEACTEFLRIPTHAHVLSLAKRYDHAELFPFPLAVQLMGSDPGPMAEMCQILERKSAPRIDLNCGCPSNTVTGKGAGASLLKDPELLFRVAKTMKESVSIPVSAKLRSGFEDTSLFIENLLAAEQSGLDFITLHPRTKKQGYLPPADWSLITQAKQILNIPVIGNGDILNVSDALNMLKTTHCDALMIGRGAIINPWIFHEIKAHFKKAKSPESFSNFQLFLKTFISHLSKESPMKNKINHLKQLSAFLFERTEKLKFQKKKFLTTQFTSLEKMSDCIESIMLNYYF